jgi:hypothetical protein
MHSHVMRVGLTFLIGVSCTLAQAQEVAAPSANGPPIALDELQKKNDQLGAKLCSALSATRQFHPG